MLFMVRRGIAFNAADETILADLQKRTGQGITGVIRLALRKLNGDFDPTRLQASPDPDGSVVERSACDLAASK